MGAVGMRLHSSSGVVWEGLRISDKSRDTGMIKAILHKVMVRDPYPVN